MGFGFGFRFGPLFWTFHPFRHQNKAGKKHHCIICQKPSETRICPECQKKNEEDFEKYKSSAFQNLAFATDTSLSNEERIQRVKQSLTDFKRARQFEVYVWNPITHKKPYLYKGNTSKEWIKKLKDTLSALESAK